MGTILLGGNLVGCDEARCEADGRSLLHDTQPTGTCEGDSIWFLPNTTVVFPLSTGGAGGQPALPPREDRVVMVGYQYDDLGAQGRDRARIDLFVSGDDCAEGAGGEQNGLSPATADGRAPVLLAGSDQCSARGAILECITDAQGRATFGIIQNTDKPATAFICAGSWDNTDGEADVSLKVQVGVSSAPQEGGAE